MFAYEFYRTPAAHPSVLDPSDAGRTTAANSVAASLAKMKGPAKAEPPMAAAMYPHGNFGIGLHECLG
jgi:hypothetical protein